MNPGRTNSRIVRTVTGIVATAALALPLSACGTDDATTSAGSSGSSDGAGSSGSSESAEQPQQSATSKPEPVAEVDNLTGKTTAVKLDKGFANALKQLKLTPGTVGDGKLTKKGSLVFPITGGNVTYYEPGSIDPYVQGRILHDGSGFSLSAGKTTAEFTDFVVDPATSQLFGDVSVNGKSAAKDAFLFQLDGRTLEPLQTKGSKAILEGTKVEISPVAAGLLNKTFKTKAVEPGLLVGIAKITIETK